MSKSVKDTYILYGTAECHLCESAKALVIEAGIEHLCVDIIDDALLYSRYERLIPVLVHPAHGAELCWPFSLADLRNFKSLRC